MKKLKRLKAIQKKTLDESNMIESGKTELTEEGEKHNVVNGVILLNTCMTCHTKFKPANSMIYETSCNVCSEKK